MKKRRYEQQTWHARRTPTTCVTWHGKNISVYHTFTLEFNRNWKYMWKWRWSVGDMEWKETMFWWNLMISLYTDTHIKTNLNNNSRLCYATHRMVSLFGSLFEGTLMNLVYETISWKYMWRKHDGVQCFNLI
jgi:hypothetical protein